MDTKGLYVKINKDVYDQLKSASKESGRKIKAIVQDALINEFSGIPTKINER